MESFGANSVVDVKVSLTPPTVSVVSTSVLYDDDAVCLTVKVSPLTHVPDELVYEPPFLL